MNKWASGAKIDPAAGASRLRVRGLSLGHGPAMRRAETGWAGWPRGAAPAAASSPRERGLQPQSEQSSSATGPRSGPSAADARPGPSPFPAHMGQSRLFEAAESGDVEELKAAVAAGADVGEFNGAGRAAVHVAAMEGRLEAIQFLIAQGVSVNEPNAVRCLRCAEMPLDLASLTRVGAERGHPAAPCRVPWPHCRV